MKKIPATEGALHVLETLRRPPALGVPFLVLSNPCEPGTIKVTRQSFEAMEKAGVTSKASVTQTLWEPYKTIQGPHWGTLQVIISEDGVGIPGSSAQHSQCQTGLSGQPQGQSLQKATLLKEKKEPRL